MTNASTLEDDLRAAVSAALDAGWSYNRLANEMGLPVPVLNRWHHGTRSIKLETAQKMCDFFGTRLTKINTIPKP